MKPTRAKNQKDEPIYLKADTWWSYDKNIWTEICAEFAQDHQISVADFIKIIAFCYPGWGSRTHTGSHFVYHVSEEEILDSQMGWAKFKRELNKSVRLMKNKIHLIDDLWESRKASVDEDAYTYQPQHQAYDLESFEDVGLLDEEYVDCVDAMMEVPVGERDNLLYGSYEDED